MTEKYTDDNNTNKSNKLNLVKKSKVKCFTRETAEKSGFTMQTIRNRIKIGSLIPEVTELIFLSSGRVSTRKKYKSEITQTKALYITRLTPEEQKLFVELYQEYYPEVVSGVKDLCDYIISLRIK